MNFLISPAGQDELVLFGPDTYFESADGSLFSYRVKFLEDDMIVIEDTFGRYVPLDIEEVDSLIDVLQRISAFQQVKLVCKKSLSAVLLDGADLEA